MSVAAARIVLGFWVLLLAYIQAAHALEALPVQPPAPADNPITAAKIELGKQLFFDPRLSVDGTVSCNSCHDVTGSGTDNRAVSVGVGGRKGSRSAPTVWNAAFLSSQFWDGRADTLEEQAKGPILNPVEMGMPNPLSVVERIRRIPGYRRQFTAVFGGDEPVTWDNIARAIATYERTLITPDSPVDRYLRGNGQGLSESAKRGMQRVQDLGCTACHSGPNFSGPLTEPVARRNFQKFPAYTDSVYVRQYRLRADAGRFNVTGLPKDRHIWRVSTWRNVALTAPYFHNGAVRTLDEAVRVMAKTQLNTDLHAEQVADIVAFLEALTGTFPAQDVPRLP